MGNETLAVYFLEAISFILYLEYAYAFMFRRRAETGVASFSI